MQGIYKIENRINGNIYIGLSSDIEQRWKDHLYRALNDYGSNREYDKVLYQAIRKYGASNFDFTIIEELPDLHRIELCAREKFWIEHYNSFKKGYNCSPGGDEPPNHDGDNHPRHKLTSKDVTDIRVRWAAMIETNKEIYLDYHNQVHWTGFSKVVAWDTWKKQDQELNTLEAREWHFLKHQRDAAQGQSNAMAKLTSEIVIEARKRNYRGETAREIFNDYEYTGIKYASFQKMLCYNSWKHITREEIANLCKE